MLSIIRIVLVLISFSVAAQSPKVTMDKDHKWKEHPTFQLDSGELVLVLKAEVDRDKILQAIRDGVKEQMISKGYKEVPSNASMKITFTAELVETENVQDMGPLGQTPADNAADVGQNRMWSQERREGSVAIDISRAGDGKSVWRSSATTEFAGEDLATTLKAVAYRSLRKLPKQKK